MTRDDTGPGHFHRNHERGQTLLDFAIGMAIFLLVLGYVFAFIPSLFGPFLPETDSTAIRADRTAALLTEDILARNDTQRVLNETCTRDFFEGTAVADGCKFDRQVDDQTALRTITALPSRTQINVTMVRDGNVVRATGPAAAKAGGRIIRSIRIVSFDGRDYRFVVKLW